MSAIAPQATMIPVEDIHAGDNDRKVFTEAELESLASSVREIGIIQPATVRPLSDGKYQLISGERRWRAARLAELDSMPCLVREDLTESKVAEVMLAENTARVDLNPIEEAAAYQARLDDGVDVQAVARSAGVSVRRVNARLPLLGLDDAVQDLVKSGQIGPSNAHRMVGLTSSRQRLAVRAISTDDISQAQVHRTIDELHKQQNEEPLFTLSNEEFVLSAREIARNAIPRRTDLVALVKEAAKALEAAGLNLELVERMQMIER